MFSSAISASRTTTPRRYVPSSHSADLTKAAELSQRKHADILHTLAASSKR